MLCWLPEILSNHDFSSLAVKTLELPTPPITTKGANLKFSVLKFSMALNMEL
jgi:hypothetical protein